MLPTLKRSVRRAIVRPWWLSKLWYRLHGLSLSGAPDDEVWYFAFGSNMHDGVFRKRRRMHPSEWRVGRIKNYRLCFNLEGRPWGKTTPANIEPCPGDEVWGVIYRITKRDLVRLDSTESMPGGGYRRLCLGAEDADKRPIKAFACITRGEETDGNPSLRYITSYAKVPGHTACPVIGQVSSNTFDRPTDSAAEGNVKANRVEPGRKLP